MMQPPPIAMIQGAKLNNKLTMIVTNPPTASVVLQKANFMNYSHDRLGSPTNTHLLE